MERLKVLMGKKQGGKSGWSVQLGTSCEGLGQIVSVIRVDAAGDRQQLEARRMCGGVQPFPLLTDASLSAKILHTRGGGHTDA